MAKVSLDNRNLYFEKVKPYREVIQSILNREDELLKNIEEKGEKAALKLLDMAEEMIYLTTNYIVLSSVSEAMLRVRNGSALNEARKTIYKAVICLEKVVSPLIDAAFSEYEEQLEEISSVDAQRRYHIVKKMGLAIRLLDNAFGENHKWKWAFVELEGRYAAVAKNIIDLKTAVANTDPRSADYEPTVRHLRLIKRLLQNTADRYRQKYESSTKNADDLKMGIQFLDSLRRIHTVLSERRDGEIVKKKAETWKMRLESGMENQQAETLKIIENG